MPSQFRRVTVAALFLLACQCSSDSGTEPAVQCASGSADEALFNQYFDRMALVDRASGLPGQADPQLGERYPSNAVLELRMDAKAPVSVRACVEVRDGSGTVARDVSHSAATGSSGVELGSFAANASGYVVRVTVNTTLVKNFPFVTQ